MAESGAEWSSPQRVHALTIQKLGDDLTCCKNTISREHPSCHIHVPWVCEGPHFPDRAVVSPAQLRAYTHSRIHHVV